MKNITTEKICVCGSTEFKDFEIQARRFDNDTDYGENEFKVKSILVCEKYCLVYFDNINLF